MGIPRDSPLQELPSGCSMKPRWQRQRCPLGMLTHSCWQLWFPKLQ